MESNVRQQRGTPRFLGVCVFACIHVCARVHACVCTCVCLHTGVPLRRGWEWTPPVGVVVAEASGMISNFLDSPMNLGFFNLHWQEIETVLSGEQVFRGRRCLICMEATSRD